MVNRKGINEVYSFIISVIIVAVIVVIVVYILLLGTGTIKSVGSNTNSYVSQTESAITSGISILTGGSVSLDNHQFLAQFYGTRQCLNLLNGLSAHGILQNPTNPSTLSNTFFVCIGSYNDFSFYVGSQGPYQSSWQAVTSWGSPAPPLWYSQSNLAGMNGSEGTVTFENTTGSSISASNIISYFNESCTNFLNATVDVSGTQEYNDPQAYITSMNCVPIENAGVTYFISVETPQCGANPQMCSGNPLLFIHGSPASISQQVCRYYGGPSIICEISLV